MATQAGLDVTTRSSEAPETVASNEINPATAQPSEIEALIESAVCQIVQPGSYRQRKRREAWSHLFDDFRSEVLEQDPTEPFQENQLPKFLLHFFAKYQPMKDWDIEADNDLDDDEFDCARKLRSEFGRIDDPSYAWSRLTADNAIRALQERFEYRWDNFTLSSRQKQQAEAVIDFLIIEGLVTTVEKITRDQPMCVYYVRRMVKGLLVDSLTNGTSDWDSIIQFSLLFVVQAALYAGPSKILVPDDEQERQEMFEPGLRYSDVELALDDGSTISDVKGRWRLRSDRHYDERRRVALLERNALDSGEDNLLCPVRILLINATRQGNVHGNTIEEVLGHAARSWTHKIAWKNPNLPVFYQVSDKEVSRTTPMSISAMRGALDAVARVVRPNLQLRFHDITYGAAEDLLRLEKSRFRTLGEIYNVMNVGSEEGHHFTMTLSKDDTWQARVELPDERDLFSDVVFENESDPATTADLLSRLARKRKRAKGNNLVEFLASV